MARSYDQVSMYVYSGTGNALKAARWIADEAEAVGTKSEVTLIDHLTRSRSTEPGFEGERTLLGFLYSTHGFCAPWTMLKFLFRFPRRGDRDVDAFLVNTRGGLKVGSLRTPGVSGLAVLIPLIILWLKGYRVIGTRPLDMPSSWHQLHPALSSRAIAYITGHCHGQVVSYAARLLAGQRAFNGWWTLPLDLALTPITILYLLVGRYGLGKLQMASADCNGCRLCEKLCPCNAIEIRKGRPFWTIRCESCMRCMSVCPKRATQTAHSATVLLTIPFVVLIPLIHHLVWPFVELLPQMLHPLGWLLYGLFWLVLTIVSVVVPYWLLDRLWRIKVVNDAFTYTSLTKYFRRYLALGITKRDLTPRRSVSEPVSDTERSPSWYPRQGQSAVRS